MNARPAGLAERWSHRRTIRQFRRARGRVKVCLDCRSTFVGITCPACATTNTTEEN